MAVVTEEEVVSKCGYSNNDEYLLDNIMQGAGGTYLWLREQVSDIHPNLEFVAIIHFRATMAILELRATYFHLSTHISTLHD